MRRFRTLALASAATLGLGGAALFTAPSAGAAGDPAVGKQVLDLLCGVKGGTSYFSPMTISRCQDARPLGGFAVEERICEGFLGGTFERVSSTNRPQRVNWFCFHGPITA